MQKILRTSKIPRSPKPSFMIVLPGLLLSSQLLGGSFSETTTASFSADMYLGSVDGESDLMSDSSSEEVMAAYGFQIDLNTSFTGEDSLDVSLDSGSSGSESLLDVSDMSSDALEVDGVSYAFPLGDRMTVTVGDNTDGSALFSTACVYGGPSDILDDCGNVNAGIPEGGGAAGASYDFGSGFTAALSYTGSDGAEMSNEGMDVYGVNAAYTGDYGVSLIYGAIDQTNEESIDGAAVNAYYTPEGLPSISVGYELDAISGVAPDAASDDESQYFIGLTWDDVGPGSLDHSIGTGTVIGGEESPDEQYMYEAYYSYPLNDGMTVTPLVFTKEEGSDSGDDETSVMVKTSFSF